MTVLPAAVNRDAERALSRFGLIGEGAAPLVAEVGVLGDDNVVDVAAPQDRLDVIVLGGVRPASTGFPAVLLLLLLVWLAGKRHLVLVFPGPGRRGRPGRTAPRCGPARCGR